MISLINFKTDIATENYKRFRFYDIYKRQSFYSWLEKKCEKDKNSRQEKEKIIITEESREQGRHKIEAGFNRSQVL